MARLARIVIPNCPHHVTQRGNHRRTIFSRDSERSFYLKLLDKHLSLSKVQLTGYALMTNHVHHIMTPPTPRALSRTVGQLHCDFARWQQMQRNLTGHLWQNRFFSCPLEEDHFWEALRYVEMNPVRAGLVKNPWDWPWSSARAHVTGVDATGLLNMELWKKRFNGAQWKSFLLQAQQESIQEGLRLATRTGRAFGSEEFVIRLENITGRKLRPKKPGPKPGSKFSRRRRKFGN
jgi:putative transposase